MNSNEYRWALKSPKWASKRKFILKRDDYSCVKCRSKKNLHVHHKYYLRDRLPWEVPNDCLVTLCALCHEKAHANRSISSFILDKPPKTKVKQKNKSKKVNKPRDLESFTFIAIKSESLQKVFSKSSDWAEIHKKVGGVIKGFDNKNLAEYWLRKNTAGKVKKATPKKKKKVINKYEK